MWECIQDLYFLHVSFDVVLRRSDRTPRKVAEVALARAPRAPRVTQMVRTNLTGSTLLPVTLVFSTYNLDQIRFSTFFNVQLSHFATFRFKQNTKL